MDVLILVNMSDVADLMLRPVQSTAIKPFTDGQQKEDIHEDEKAMTNNRIFVHLNQVNEITRLAISGITINQTMAMHTCHVWHPNNCKQYSAYKAKNTLRNSCILAPLSSIVTLALRW